MLIDFFHAKAYSWLATCIGVNLDSSSEVLVFALSQDPGDNKAACPMMILRRASPPRTSSQQLSAVTQPRLNGRPRLV